MAFCWLQRGVRGQVDCITPPICEHLPDEQCDTCCGTTSRDVASKEAMEDTGEPMSPRSFRGFRLHTIWTQQPGGELARQISFPRFLGESFLPLLEYESEKFPQGLRQGQKRALSLKPPSTDHWNIALNLVLPLTLDESRRRREAKWVAQGLEGRSEGAKVSPEAPTPGESSQPEVGGSGAALSVSLLRIGSESWRLYMNY